LYRLEELKTTAVHGSDARFCKQNNTGKCSAITCLTKVLRIVKIHICNDAQVSSGINQQDIPKIATFSYEDTFWQINASNHVSKVQVGKRPQCVVVDQLPNRTVFSSHLNCSLLVYGCKYDGKQLHTQEPATRKLLLIS